MTEGTTAPMPVAGDAGWVTLTDGAAGPGPDEPLRWWRPVGGVVVVALLVFAGVAAASAVVARRTAEREAVNDALATTDLLAAAVVQPDLRDPLLSGDPAAAAAARQELDPVVRRQVLSATIVRVKLWRADGTILYSDEPRLVGERFELDEEEREVLREPATQAEVSDLDAPENRYERPFGKLLEVYRPVWTPSGQPLLLETYSRYDAVVARSSALWRGFGGITITSMLLLLLAQAPLTWALIRRVQRAQAEREAWLHRAVEASDDERRRIAAALHDGAVQELAASAFLVAGAADRARARDDAEGARQLDTAAGTVRSSIGGLRSLLVDIYPPALRSAGLAGALRDLVAPMRSRDVEVSLVVPEDVQLPERVEATVHRVAQEALRNVGRHADASWVDVVLTAPEEGPVLLEITDDGAGFDVEAALARPAEGHFGLRLLADLAGAGGGTLRIRSAPGEGTALRLEVPL